MTSDPFIIKEDKINDSIMQDYTSKNEEGNFFNFRKTSSVQRLGQLISIKKLKFLKFFLAFFLTIIIFKVFFLQIINGGNYRLLAEGNRIRLDREKAQRGIIYDRNGAELVINKPTFTLYLNVNSFKESELVFADQLMNLNSDLKISDDDISDLIQQFDQQPYLPMIIKENLTYDEALKIRMDIQDIPGFYVNVEAYRYYPYGKYTSHVLGYLGKISESELAESSDYAFNDKIGKTGIELIYEDVLKGQDGYKEIEVDSLGKEKKIISQKDPFQGDSLSLTIDIDLQKKLYDSVEYYLKRFNKTKGAAVALDPNNGEILALVSFPGYDDNLFSLKTNHEEYQEILTNPDQPLFNRAISGEYPSGSTIKPLIAAAALEEGIITPDFTVNSTGGIWYGEWFFPDWKAGGHGTTNVVKALAESVNTFFYLIGIDEYKNFKGLGIDRLVEYLQKFNFGKTTGIDLPSEKDGFIPTPEWKLDYKNETWYPGDTFHLSIGQGDLLVTPLQIADLTSFFASAGYIYQPKLVKSVSSQQKTSIFDKKLLVDNIINPDNINTVREGMKAVIDRGSGRYLAGLPVSTAGKTGTAQAGTNDDPHAWFTVFGPYDNPEITLTIIIENGGEGSTVAVPIAYDVLNWYFTK